ncbi:unnamed protein product [Urochloa humidicola]
MERAWEGLRHSSGHRDKSATVTTALKNLRGGPSRRVCHSQTSSGMRITQELVDPSLSNEYDHEVASLCIHHSSSSLGMKLVRRSKIIKPLMLDLCDSEFRRLHTLKLPQ